MPHHDRLVRAFAPNTFSVPIPNSETPTSTPIRRSPTALDKLIYQWDPSVSTTWENLVATVKTHPKTMWFGTRVVDPHTQRTSKYRFRTYEQCYADILAFGSGVRNLDLCKPDAENKLHLLGIMGMNCPQWVTAEFGAIMNGVTIVPLYTSTAPAMLSTLLQECGCATVVCDAQSAVSLCKAKPTLECLKTLIMFGPVDVPALDAPTGLEILTFEAVLANGRASPQSPSPPKPSDIYSFGYTSGSTGTPKAAMITHRNQVAQITALSSSLAVIDGQPIARTDVDVFFSFLPMAHAMERAFQSICIKNALTVCFSQGKRETLMDDIKACRPTIFPAVPRLLNTIQNTITSRVASKGNLAATLFNRGLSAKLARLNATGRYWSSYWDTLVFMGIRKQLGLERCRFIMTGSAPIAGAVMNFFRVVFGCIVVEGYGSTEMTCAVTSTTPLTGTTEHVGGPVDAIEIRLENIPEMNYLASDTKHFDLRVLGRGEICVRGELIMQAYYRSPDATAKCIDAQGWYHSGDVGCFLPDGTLKIIDRVRNIFKLSIGEYVAPEKVEGVCLRAPLVLHAFVHGDAFHPKLVAVIVPEPAAAKAWAIKHNCANANLTELCAKPEFKKAVEEEIGFAAKTNSLMSYEIPKVIALLPDQFEIGDILTPTMKLQRQKAVEKFRTILDDMLGPMA